MSSAPRSDRCADDLSEPVEEVPAFWVWIDREPPRSAIGSDADGESSGCSTTADVPAASRREGPVFNRLLKIDSLDRAREAFALTFG